MNVRKGSSRAKPTYLRYRSAQEALEELGKKFAEVRASSREDAWREVQAILMSNLDLLCPERWPLKDALATAQGIEDMLKGTTARAGQSPLELLRAYLNTGELEPKTEDAGG